MLTIDLPIGTIIEGKYRIDALMGKGGMGSVFRVTHLQLNKDFALKVVTADNSQNNDALIARFRREAEILAKVAHPNIVMITDFGVMGISQTPYIVMEYIEGISLREILTSKGTLSEKETIHIAKQLCSGLHAAHTKGIIHRDLKPENIMIQSFSKGEVIARVLDFGIAKLIGSQDENQSNLSSGQMLGTLKYSSPEQVYNLPIDARTDVFSLCLVLYEMLVGKVPPAVVMKVAPIANTIPYIIPELDELILKGLLHAPEDRFQDMLEMRSTLEDLETNFSQTASTLLSLEDREILAKAPKEHDTGSKNSRTTDPKSLRRNTTGSNKSSETSPNTSFEDRDPKSKAMYWLISSFLIIAITGIFAWQFAPSFLGQNTVETTNSKIDYPMLISIKAGKAQIGSNKGDDYIAPEHTVDITSFEVSNLITNQQYSDFVTQTKHQPPNNWKNGKCPPEIAADPVTNITWSDASSYCNWLSVQISKSCRLLTEEEWEYLARNRATFGVSNIASKTAEWTNSKFKLYPGSKAKLPKLSDVRIIRGQAEEENADPLTYRLWQVEKFSSPILGFRVATTK